MARGIEIEPGALRARKMAALDFAHARRRQLKELRLALKEGEVDPFDLIIGHEDPVIEECVARTKLGTFLPMLRGIGNSKAMEIIAAFRATPNMRVGDFNKEQRENLAYIVRGAMNAYRG